MQLRAQVFVGELLCVGFLEHEARLTAGVGSGAALFPSAARSTRTDSRRRSSPRYQTLYCLTFCGFSASARTHESCPGPRPTHRAR